MNNFQEVLQAAQSLQNTYFKSRKKELLTKVLATWEKVLSDNRIKDVSTEDRLGIVSNVAVVYTDSYYVTGRLDHLGRSIQLAEEAVRESDRDSVNFTTFVNNLASVLTDRFNAVGELRDLNRAIDLISMLVETSRQDTTNLPMYLNNLGSALIARYEHVKGKADDLESAIRSFKKSVDLTLPNSNRLSDRLNNLGGALFSRYTMNRDVRALEEAIGRICEAVKITNVKDSRLPKYLLNQGIGFSLKYSSTGDVEHLDEAIVCFEKTSRMLPDNSAFLPNCVNELGTGLLDRFLCMGEIKDLERAVSYFDRAYRLSEKGSPNRPRFLGNLANALNHYCNYKGNEYYIGRAIEAARKSVRDVSDNSPEAGRFHSFLAIALNNRFKISKDENDLHESIENFKKAAQLSASGSSDIPHILNALGVALQELYDLTENASFLEESFSYILKAVNITPEASPVYPRHINSLGTVLSRRYALYKNVVDEKKSIEAFERAARGGLSVDLNIALVASVNWVNWLFGRRSWIEIVRAEPYVSEAVDRLVRLQIFRDDKELVLSQIQGLAAKIAYALAKEGRVQQSVTTLERGLARLYGASLSTDHRRLLELRQTGRFDLYEDYQRTVHEIEMIKRRGPKSDQDYKRLQNLRDKISTLVESIRLIPGYGDFLESPDFEEIAELEATIVYMMATEAGGLALVVREDASAIWLPELTTKRCLERIAGSNDKKGYLKAYHEWINKGQTVSRFETWLSEMEEITKWMWNSAIEKLIQVVTPNEKISLVPVGHLALLPLHAAWKYDDTSWNGRRYALDVLRMSYAPNARSLRSAATSRRKKDYSVLCVDEPLPVRASPLALSKSETKCVSMYFKKQEVLSNEVATLSTVLEKMGNHSVIHLSCHGEANLSEPLASGLWMAGNEVLAVRDLLDRRLDGVRLVSLSACETGIPGMNLPDEVVSLPSAILQAGAGGVVSSFWAVNEISSLMIMIRFYDFWQSENLSPSDALREAETWLRDSSMENKKEYLTAVWSRMKWSKKELTELIAKVQRTDFSELCNWAAFSYSGL